MKNFATKTRVCGWRIKHGHDECLLAKKLKEWAEAQVESGRYANVSDYVRDLIRREQDRLASIAEIQAALNDGEASGYVAYSRSELEGTLGMSKGKNAA